MEPKDSSEGGVGKDWSGRGKMGFSTAALSCAAVPRSTLR